MESLASEMRSKDNKSFWEKFEQKTEAPKFNGDANEWDEYKRKFISFLGEMNLKQLISKSKDPDKICKFDEKNRWLYHLLNKNVKGAAITLLTKLSIDDQSVIISDGRAAWIVLCGWNKSLIVKQATVQNARAYIKMRSYIRTAMQGNTSRIW